MISNCSNLYPIYLLCVVGKRHLQHARLSGDLEAEALIFPGLGSSHFSSSNSSFYSLSAKSKLKYPLQCNQPQISGHHPIFVSSQSGRKRFIVCRVENCLHGLLWKHRSQEWASTLSPTSNSNMITKTLLQTGNNCTQIYTHTCRTALLPELILVNFHNLPLQFEGLFREQLEVTDVVWWVLLWVIIPQLSYKEGVILVWKKQTKNKQQ